VEGRDVEAKTETETSRGSAALGIIEITLLVDSRGGAYRTTSLLREAVPTLAREIPTLLGALLFAERQMRMTSDPMRLTAVDRIANACHASRAGSLAASTAITPRTIATYQVKVIAGQTFRADVEAKMDGVLADVAGGEVVSALTNELLVSLAEPYRTFYREMLEAAVNHWRERRPSLVDTTWHWPTALRHLDQLTQGGAVSLDAPQMCAACGAIRPSDQPCLRCGAASAAPRLNDLIANVSGGSAVPTPAGSLLETDPVSTAPMAQVTPTAAATTPVPTILPAKDMSDFIKENEEPPPPQYAAPGRRLAASLLDLVSGLILGAIGGFGLTSILVSSGAFGPADSPVSVAITTAIVVLAIYLVIGWTKGETLGMALLKLRLVKAADQRPAGFGRALLRALGYLGLLVLAFAVFYLLNQIDNLLVFIQGTADLIVRIIVGLITLYVIWMGSGQLILGGQRRQSWGDRLAGTIVTIKQA